MNHLYSKCSYEIKELKLNQYKNRELRMKKSKHTSILAYALFKFSP